MCPRGGSRMLSSGPARRAGGGGFSRFPRRRPFRRFAVRPRTDREPHRRRRRLREARLMGTKANPGKFDCYAAARPDEPMFHLLGRDKHAPILIELWASMREFDGEDPAKVAEARE